MADQPAGSPKRRIVKNPETFRERAIKATDESDKPGRAARFKSGASKVSAPVFRPIGRTSAWLGRFKPLRVIGKVIFPSYFRQGFQELKLVKWPDWQTSRQLTFAVLVFAVIFGAVVAVVDYGLDKVFKNVLLK